MQLQFHYCSIILTLPIELFVMHLSDMFTSERLSTTDRCQVELLCVLL